jgi:Ca2+-binding RTX toxin-like protein
VTHLVTGAQELSFTNGSVDIELAAGQSTFMYSLVSRGDVDQDAQINLSAALLDSNQQPIEGSETSLAVSVIADQEATPTAGFTVIGDQAPTLSDHAIVYDRPPDASPLIPADWIGNIRGDGSSPGRSDRLIGTGGSDELDGLDGSDAIVGADGDDLIDGGNGADYITAGLGDDHILGGAGDDLIAGGATIVLRVPKRDDDPMFQPSGNFPVVEQGWNWAMVRDPNGDLAIENAGIITGTGSSQATIDGADYIDGGEGNDNIDGGYGDDTILGGLDNDRLTGAPGADHIEGGEGDDVIRGDVFTSISSGGVYYASASHGSDFIDAGAGNDLVSGDGGGDTILGGDGNDTLWGDTNDTTATPLEVHGEDFLDGGAGEDVLRGGAASDVLYGGIGNDQLIGDDVDQLAGDDYLNGEDGDDQLFGAAGSDTLLGGVGSDTLVGDNTSSDITAQGNDYLDGGDGNDTLFGQGGEDVLIGGADDDELYGESSDVLADAQADDYLSGGAGADLLVGAGGADTLFGGEGNDTLFGDFTDAPAALQVDDYLDGEDGDDILIGAGGADVLIGGTGNDQLFGDHSTTPESVQLGDFLDGGEGNDTLQGYGGDDTLQGGAGDDLLIGDAGNDVLDGGEGADQLQGGDGNDVLTGGDGDVLFGQAGDDVFIVSGNATVVDQEGNNTLLAELDDDDLRIQLVDGRVAFTNSAGESVSMSQQTLQSLSHIETSSMSFDSADQAIQQLYRTATLGSSDSDPYYNVIRLGVGVRAEEVGLLSSEQDLVLTYSGSTSEWIDVDDLEERGALVSMRDGARYGLAAGTQTLVIHNWYQSQRYDYLGIFLDDAGIATNFAASALEIPRNYWGTNGSDVFTGDQSDDRFTALDGDDFVSGADGNDVLDGGLGNDQLLGGAGDDVYVVGAGGNDLIVDESGSMDIVRFTSSVAPSDIGLSESDSSLVMQVGADGSNTITIADWNVGSTSVIERVEFADGTVWRPYDVDVRLSGNHRPYLLNPIANQVAHVGQMFSFAVREDAFADPNSDDALTFSASLADGSALPSWLAFDSVTRTFSGIPADGGTIDLLIQATDPAGLTATDKFQLWVPAPVTLSGTAAADVLVAQTSDDHRIYGLGGNDTLTGGAGSDVLVGGIGADTVTGGGGSDTYLYSIDDGDDFISANRDSDPNSIDVVQFGEGIRPEDVYVERAAYNSNTLVLRVRDARRALVGSVNVAEGFNPGFGQEILDQVEFADGTVWDRNALYAAYLTGSALPDTINGFSGGDVIEGNAGQDIIRGGSGDDMLIGGADSDQLDGEQGNDTYVFARGDGYDEIKDAAGINRISLGGTVAPQDVQLYRSSGSTFLNDGEATSTSDTLVAVIAGTSDEIRIENYFASGTYRPIAEITFADGTVWDSAEIDARLINESGTANTMTGTSADDVFLVDHRGDRINESANAGVDTIQSAVTFTLSTNVENLTLTGTLAAAAMGNELQNVITGNDASNYLFGGSQPGNTDGIDTLIGQGGDDTYRVVGTTNGYDNFNDIVVEAPNDGYDTIIAQSYSAQMPGNVEAMVVYGPAYGIYVPAPRPQRITGNDLDNFIDASGEQTYGYGFVLDGGAGADLMIGPSYPTFNSPQDSSIRYVVDNSGDRIIAGTGREIVQSSATFAMSDGLEDIELVGSAAISATGNRLDNRLDGSLNDASNDLFGGTGNDEYRLGAGDAAYEAANEGIDTIVLMQADGAPSYTLAPNVENLTLATTGPMELIGNDGDNVIKGASTGNTFDGRGGNDVFVGSGASDRYVGFGTDSGMDAIVEASGEDVIEFDGTQSVRVEDLQITQAGSDLVIGVSSQAAITVRSWFSMIGSSVEQLTIQEAGLTYVYSAAQLESRALGNNSAPMVNVDAANELMAPEGVAGVAYEFQLPANLFSDIDSQHSLAYSVSSFDGEPLPAWLTFDPTTRTLNGTPGAGEYGLVDILVTATDDGGLSASLPLLTAVFSSRMEGTSDADILNGDATPNLIYGLAGDDDAHGGEGFDEIFGAEGNDDLYGEADDDALYGGEGDDVLDGGEGSDWMEGGEGDDTYIVESSGDALWEMPGEGRDHVFSHIDFSLTSEVEDLTLLGDAAVEALGNDEANHLIGNSADNYIEGYDGDDYLDGGAGIDELHGDAGDDIYVVDAGDTVIEQPAEGIDEIRSTATWTLGAEFENLTLLGASNINGTGNSRANQVLGNAGNNALDGGAGIDVLIGGAGNDTYVVDSTADVVTEYANEGSDLVRSQVSYALGESVENLTLLGYSSIAGTGNELDNLITGNSGNNTLTGNAGNDTLNGGSGNDTLLGGVGDDIYVVAQTGDVVAENSGEGTDLIQSSITYTLGTNVENLTLTGSGRVNGTGNELDNVLTGNGSNNTLDGSAGNDVLDGRGGSDTLIGGSGNDIYVVAQTADVVIESANEGTDLVQASVTYTLGNDIENLTLTGSSAISGTGNALDNVLIGNSGSNTLTGNGGNDTLDGGSAGTDKLKGGTGDDVYIVGRSSGITITENANEGTDTVKASVTYTLGSTSNLENVTLTGTSAINATGNSAANVLIGNDGNNTLTGSAGNDTLIGGNGADIYSYSSGHGADTIDNSSTDAAQDRLNVTNLTRSQVTFTQSGNDLLMSRNGSSTDSVRVANWFANNTAQLDFVQFTDQTLTATQINALFGGSTLQAPDRMAVSTSTLQSESVESSSSSDPELAQSVDALFASGASAAPVVSGSELRAKHEEHYWDQRVPIRYIKLRSNVSVLEGGAGHRFDAWSTTHALLSRHLEISDTSGIEHSTDNHAANPQWLDKFAGILASDHRPARTGIASTHEAERMF